MTNRRFIQSIVATAHTTGVAMPWHRDLRAQKVKALRDAKVVTLRTAKLQRNIAA
ncbi:MAG: hypothetical protein ACPG7W_03465 [Paracoccaceae bacterium]